nr:hypothetical protein [Pandoravirus massiliensis]
MGGSDVHSVPLFFQKKNGQERRCERKKARVNAVRLCFGPCQEKETTAETVAFEEEKVQICQNGPGFLASLVAFDERERILGDATPEAEAKARKKGASRCQTRQHYVGGVA